jgi:hypothetical protein
VPRFRRAALLVAAVLLGAALLAGAAHAALTLVFSRTTVEPGEVVRVRTGGSGALTHIPRKPPLRVFLAPKTAEDHIRSPRDRRLRLLGRLTADRNGDGRLRFSVPNLAPGEYTTFIHCGACAHSSNGRTMLPGGPWGRPFRVEPVRRGCGETQTGDLASDWRSRAVEAGPLALYPMPSRASEAVQGRPGYFRPVKVLVILTPGSTATLAVPQSQRGAIGLAYGRRAGFGRFAPAMRVAGGLSAVTFQSCPSASYPREHFGGGFVVSRPMCAELEVQVGRRAPISLRVPFGRAC